jgi:CBS domain-containing protein
MKLAQILEAKGRAVVTAAPHRTLSELVGLLHQKRIGAVLIVGADEAVLGILSERDVIRALALQGPEVLGDAASRHMTSDLVSATADMTVEDAMEQMTEGRFRHMPVIEQGRLVGLISIGDVVKHRIETAEQEKKSMLDYITAA